MSAERRRAPLPSAIALLALVITALSAIPAAWALSDVEIQARIRETLTQRHPKDDRAWWRALGPGTPGVIIRLFEASAEEYERHRLVGALGHFGDDAAAVEYLRRLAEGSEESLLRGTALQSVAAAQGAEAVDFVAKFLSHPDPQTRLAAGRALKSVPDPRAQEVMNRYLKEEKAAWVAQAVRGEAPRAARPLSVVSTSEDGRAGRELAGVWKGVWVEPRGQGLRTRDVQASLRSDATGEIRGELRAIPGAAGAAVADKEMTVLEFGAVRLRGTRFSGSFRIPGAAPSGPGAAGKGREPGPGFEAELREEGARREHRILMIRIPKTGATLLLRKS